MNIHIQVTSLRNPPTVMAGWRFTPGCAAAKRLHCYAGQHSNACSQMAIWGLLLVMVRNGLVFIPRGG